MKGFAVFAILAIIVALTEGSALKTSNNSMQKTTCNIKRIKANIAELINISYDARDELLHDAFSIYGGFIQCVYSLRVGDLYGCIEAVVENGVTSMYRDAQAYVNQASGLAEKVVQEVQTCLSHKM